MGFEASELVCISLVFPEKSSVGRGFGREKSDRYTWIKGSFFDFIFDFFIA